MRPKNFYLRISIFIFILMIFTIFTPQIYSKNNSLQNKTSGQATAGNLVEGNLIQFSDNGAWCWYQDERVIVDTAGGKLVIGAVANKYGMGGSPRDGDIDATIFDLQNGQSQTHTLKHAYTSYGGGDEHNTPAFLLRPDGKYLAVYAGHNNDVYSYYRIYDGQNWGVEQRFNWNLMPGGTNFNTTYSNLFYLSAEERVYNIVRGDDRSPNIMISDDMGETWIYGGQLTVPDQTIGYVNGYFKYCPNGVDRIDFIATEHHPRDFNTSIYHGYIQQGKSFQTDGTLMDDDISDKTAPNPDEYTLVFAANTIFENIRMTRAWTIDVQTYADGSIAAFFKARANNSEMDHRFFYARYDGTRWNSTHLCKAGPKLFGSEEDYTGLGTLNPDDPTTLYISTTIDPRDDTDLIVHEIFKGTTEDNGITWTWTPITRNSSRDNLRPVVPAWDAQNTALLWWRGKYSTSQRFDAAVLGMLIRSSEIIATKSYIDATATNTFLFDGSPLTATGPDANQGAADDQWHWRTDFGNNGTILTSSETSAEDAPILKTVVAVSETGLYDVWINFWGKTGADWRVKAGIFPDGMKLYRQMACQQVQAGSHNTILVLGGISDTFLYQAYLGRIQVAGDKSFEVFLDDETLWVGTTSLRIGDRTRTWYDGISYARVNQTSAINISENKTLPVEFSLQQNYPNPFNPSTRIQFRIPEQSFVSLKVYNLLGEEIAELAGKEFSTGIHSITFDASHLASGMYFYTIRAQNFIQTRKMLLIR